MALRWNTVYAASWNFEAVGPLIGRAPLPPMENWRTIIMAVYDAFRHHKMAQTGEEIPTYEENRRVLDLEEGR